VRRLRILLLLLVSVVVASSAVAALAQPPPVGFTRLRGENEVPPVVTEARGTATFWLEPDGNIRYRLVVRNMDNVTAAHIHLAPVGVNGPVIVPLFPNGQTLTGVNHVIVGSFAPPAGLLEQFERSEVYVNVHSVEFPGGEIRGQIRG
jgi:CHRD domain